MSTTYDEDVAFERVMQACRAAEAKGWKIATRRFFSTRDYTRRECCPIGAFAIEAGINPRREDDAQGRAVELFFAATRLPRRRRDRPFEGFVGVIDWGEKMHASLRRRDIRLARRVRAALWGEA